MGWHECVRANACLQLNLFLITQTDDWRASARHIRTLAACQHALGHVLRSNFRLFHFCRTVFFRVIFRELRRFSLIVRTFSKPLERNKNIKTNVSNNLSNCFHGIGLIRGPNAVFWLTLVISVLRIRQTSCKWVVNATILHYLEANKRNIMQGKASQRKAIQAAHIYLNIAQCGVPKSADKMKKEIRETYAVTHSVLHSWITLYVSYTCFNTADHPVWALSPL